jgi:F0F1-type ATP synthase assembly protein I
MTRVRFGALALLLAGVLFILYPATRPWTDESTVDGAQSAMASDAWVASHGFAMVGFVLLGLGLLAVWSALRATRAEPVATAAVVTGWLGAGLILPYYGAEDFGLHAVAVAHADGQSLDLLGIVDAVRYQPFAITIFGAGLLLLAASGVLVAVAAARSRVLATAPAVLVALGLALFLPQFFTAAPVRIAHGVLLGVGLGWLALALSRTGRRTSPAVAVS